MPRHCLSCGRAIAGRPPRHQLCETCYGEGARILTVGAKGIRVRMSKLTCRDIGLDADRVDQLIRLVEPGKTIEAKDAVQWLIKCQAKLKEVAANG